MFSNHFQHFLGAVVARALPWYHVKCNVTPQHRRIVSTVKSECGDDDDRSGFEKKSVAEGIWNAREAWEEKEKSREEVSRSLSTSDQIETQAKMVRP